MSGTLYLVATPIGNLGDLSPRGVQTLQEADFIAAEDTRVSMKLLNHFDIKKPLVSYHEHNRAAAGQAILARLLAGETCALVTDAGTPAISDPGEDLVRLAVQAGIRVTPIPGPCAALTAIMASGLPTGAFVFAGFLPKQAGARQKRLTALRDYPETLIFYESPHQLLRTLADLQSVLGDRPAVIARELTKVHEEFRRGLLSALTADFQDQPPRGEFVVMVAGRDETMAMPEPAAKPITDATIREELERRIAAGENKKDAIRMTASQLGLPRRRVYRLTVDSG